MADNFTSAQTGDWNDVATWNEADGNGWPSGTGDTCTIDNTHIVTYNISGVTQYGQITIENGRLQFSSTTNTKLYLSHNDIRLNDNNSRLYVGRSYAPIPKEYTAEIGWNTTSNNTKGIYRSKGYVEFGGDPEYYGEDDDTTLAADGDASSSIETTDDMSAKWNVGDDVYLHKYDTYDNYATDTMITQITGMSGTSITFADAVSAAFKAGGYVINGTRNVKIYKIGASTVIGNNGTNRPRMYGGGPRCTARDTMITGFYDFYVDDFIGCTLRNGWYGYNCQGAKNLDQTGNLISNYYGCRYAFDYFYYNKRFLCKIFACYYGLYSPSDSNPPIEGDIFGNYTGIHDATHIRMKGDVFSNYYAFASNCRNTTITGRSFHNRCVLYKSPYMAFKDTSIGWDKEGNSAPNTWYDMNIDHTIQTILDNVKVPSGGLNLSTRYGSRDCRIVCESYNQTLNSEYIFDKLSDIVRITADGTGDNPSQRSGGNADVLEIIPLSKCGDRPDTYEGQILQHRIWFAAGTTYTIKYYCQTDFVALYATDIELITEYLSYASGTTTSSVTSAQAVTTRSGQSDWSQYIETSFQPKQAGWAISNIKVMEYEATKKVWVDPECEVS